MCARTYNCAGSGDGHSVVLRMTPQEAQEITDVLGESSEYGQDHVDDVYDVLYDLSVSPGFGISATNDVRPVLTTEQQQAIERADATYHTWRAPTGCTRRHAFPPGSGYRPSVCGTVSMSTMWSRFEDREANMDQCRSCLRCVAGG